ncbi:MAG TPA: hypothetical protein VKP65_24175 [Rhodothermales bacterium]|nr:hypothetical protein [Rhodothermales bacterium]
MRDTFCLLSATCLLLMMLFTGCFFLGANESKSDTGFCEDRHHQYVEASESACNAAGTEVAEWIEGRCYCY